MTNRLAGSGGFGFLAMAAALAGTAGAGGEQTAAPREAREAAPTVSDAEVTTYLDEAEAEHRRLIARPDAPEGMGGPPERIEEGGNAWRLLARVLALQHLPETDRLMQWLATKSPHDEIARFHGKLIPLGVVVALTTEACDEMFLPSLLEMLPGPTAILVGAATQMGILAFLAEEAIDRDLGAGTAYALYRALDESVPFEGRLRTEDPRPAPWQADAN